MRSQAPQIFFLRTATVFALKSDIWWRGTNFTNFSRELIFLIRPTPPYPDYFYANLDELRDR